VLEIRIVDVHPSYLNTADGLFPSPADAIDDSGNYQFAGLYTLTDVDVEIISVLAIAGDVSEFINSKNGMTITVHGGSMETVLDVEAARAFGVTEVVEDFPYHEGPEEGLEPDIETDVPAQSPVVMSWGISPSEVLTEGDHLVVLFEVREVSGFSGAPSLRRIFPVHPFAVFRSVEGKWVADYADSTRDSGLRPGRNGIAGQSKEAIPDALERPECSIGGSSVVGPPKSRRNLPPAKADIAGNSRGHCAHQSTADVLTP
jgi:hypothetical protein